MPLDCTDAASRPFQYELGLPLPEDPHINRFAGLSALDLLESEQREVVRLALEILERNHRPGEAMLSPDRTKAYLQLRMAERFNEAFGVLFLDNKNRLLACEELFQGTIDSAAVYPRVVLQRTLAHNAAALILFHNHPSGVAEASDADLKITRQLQDSLKLVDVRVLDHVVVGTGGIVSFAERGLMD